MCGRTGPRFAPSCGTKVCEPRNHGRKSKPPCQPRTLISSRTCSGGTPAADEPGKKLCGDITYISTWAGVIYLATVLDCCTKKVVGYAMADHMRTSLVCQAIDMAARRCLIEEGVTVFHSDRGSQYTSQKSLDHLKSYGIRPSVGRTRVCWGNAWAELFNATLKNERVHLMVYPTKDKTMNDIASWIELRYIMSAFTRL